MMAALARFGRAAGRLAGPALLRLAYRAHRTDPSLVGTATRHRPRCVTIVVLGRPSVSPVAAALRKLHPAATVHELTPTDPVWHARLAAVGPADLVIDDGPGWGAAARLLDTFYALRAGGVLVIAGAAAEVASRRGALGRLVARAERDRTLTAPAAPPGGDPWHLGRALAAVVPDGRHVILTNRAGPVPSKLTEPETDAYLRASGPTAGASVRVFPAALVRSRCVVRESTMLRSRSQPRLIRAIEIRLRDYRDVVVAPRQVVTDGRVLTSDTFRHNQAYRLTNRTLDDVAPRFATRADLSGRAPRLAGTHFHLDSEFRGHFGHLITEQLSRLWAWPLARQLDPDAKVLVTARPGHRRLHDWELAVYEAGGIAAADLVVVDGPVRADRLIAGTPLYCHPQYVHPAILDTWRSVGDGLVERATREELPRRVFCTRRPGRRSCRNAGEVEAIFAAAGFAIVQPETYSVPDQARLFREAEVVAGFAGSAMFGVCFALDPKPLIVVRSAAYAARNEYLIGSLLGHSLTAIVCRPDDPGDFHSSYRFDRTREGRLLDRVLERLP